MKYKAFISYSHAVDGKLAPALQTGLQQFAKPWHQMRAMRTFCDKANLSANPALWSSIEKALEESEFLILIASKETARSTWVKKEIEFWQQRKPIHNILIVLSSGEIAWSEIDNDFDWSKTTALPEILQATFAEEPLWVDLRDVKATEQLSLRQAGFREAIASISATLQGKSKDDLDSLDLRLHRRAIRTAWSAGFVLVLLALIAAAGYWWAIIERNHAQDQTRIAVAQRLAAQSDSLANDQFDLALLLSLEANRLSDVAEVRQSLLNVLNSSPNVIKFFRGEALEVRAMSYAPNGKALVVGDAKGALTVLDLEKQEWLGTELIQHSAPITSLAFSPNGRILVSGGQDGFVVWNADSFTPVRRILTDASIGDVEISPDARTLAVGNSNSEVTLWSAETGELLMPPLAGHKVGNYGVFSVAFSPDGKLLASAGFDARIILWDVQSGKAMGEPLTQHALAISGLAFSPDGKQLVSGGFDNWVVFWDLETRRSLGSRSGALHRGGITDLSAHGNLVASGGRDGSIVLWDSKAHGPLARLSGQSGPVNALALSPDGRSLASGSDDGTIILFDLARNSRLGKSLEGSGDGVSAVTFSPDGKQLAASHCAAAADRVCTQGEVLFWDVNTGQLQRHPDIRHDTLTTDLVFSPDGKTLVAGDMKGSIAFWSMSSGKPIYEITGNSWGGTWLEYSPDGRRLGASSIDGTTMLWNVRSFPIVENVVLTRDSRSLARLAFSPDGKKVATAVDGVLSIWDRSGRSLERHETDDAKGVYDIEFSPDGSTLALANSNGTIALWDMRSGQPAGARLMGHTGAVTDVAFSPEGSLVSASADGTIRIWEAGTWSYVGGLLGHSGRINSLAFSADGRYLASGSDDRTVGLWKWSLESWKDMACYVANRNLTRIEWKTYLPNEEYRQTCPIREPLRPPRERR